MLYLSDIIERIVGPDRDDVSVELAEYILKLRFTEEQLRRHEYLAQRIGEGGMLQEELDELEAYVFANTFLSLLSMKAKRVLEKHQQKTP